MISPKMWDDEKFVDLPTNGKLLWCYLLSGPPSRGVPGLVVGGIPIYADALRIELCDAEAALESIVQAEMAQFDGRRRLLRVPNAPRYNLPGNQNVVKGWWRRWKELPESDLKLLHIPSLYEARYDASGKIRDWFVDVWADTFFTVGTPHSPKQGNLFDSGGLNGFETDTSSVLSGTETETVTVRKKGVQRTPKKKRKAGNKAPSAEASSVAQYLLGAIQSHAPAFSPSDKSSCLTRWSEWIDKSLRKRRTVEQLQLVIDFAHRNEDDDFWRGNMLSGRSLHEQFDRLSIQMRSKSRNVPLRVVTDDDFGRVIEDLEGQGL